MRSILFAILLTFVSVYAHADITTGLAGHWKFNDGSGYNVTDSSGNNHTGIIKGYPRWTTWPGSNGALEFNEGCEFVRIPYYSKLKTGTMTHAVWMEVKDLLRTNQAIYGWGRGDYPTPGCADNYYTFINNSNDGSYRLYGRSQSAYISDAGRNQQPYNTIAPNGTFPVGGWNHYVIVYNADDDTIKHYKNGNYVGMYDASATGIQNCGAMTTIGSQEDYCGTPAPRGPSAKMADYRVYTRALSAGDIAALYNATKPVTSDTTAPDVPTGLSATASADNISITLTWTASSDNVGGVGLGGYVIARSPSAGGTYRDIASVPAGTTIWTDHRNLPIGTNYGWASILSPSTTYYYKVKAYDKAFPANFSAYTSVVSATTISAPTTTYTLTVNVVGTFPNQQVHNIEASIACTSGTCTYSGFASGSVLLIEPFFYILGVRQNSVTSGFNGWSGAGCQGTGPCLIRMNSNQTVTAYYGSKYPPVSAARSLTDSVPGGSVR